MFLTFNPSACKYLPTPNSQLWQGLSSTHAVFC
jgi:hypothetical protein